MEENTNNNNLEIIKAKSQAEFALTPAGQMVQTFEAQQRMAKMYSSSDIVPERYKGKIGNCVIAIDMATRMMANPISVMQNMYIVHGMPSWSSQFLIACVNNSGRFTPLRYEFKGKEGSEDWACRCYAFEKTDKEHKDPLYGTWISMKMAKQEGWSTKQGSKWLTMPEQMLSYRAAAFWQRKYAPEISMGFLSKEEAEDIATVDVDYEDVDKKADMQFKESANKSHVIDMNAEEPVTENVPENKTETVADNGSNNLFDGQPGF